MSDLKKESGMCSDFCAKWSDDEYRLYLNTLKERKIAYCEEHGISVPLFDKVEDFFLTREMLFSVEPGKMQRSNESGWISVKDKLPEMYDWVLVAVGGLPSVQPWQTVAYRNPNDRSGSWDWWWHGCPAPLNTSLTHVTHWMPLPPPPEEPAP